MVYISSLIVVLSYLMVSKLPILSLKFKEYSLQGNLPKIMLLLVLIISAIFFKWLSVPLTFVFYIILSLAFKNKTP